MTLPRENSTHICNLPFLQNVTNNNASGQIILKMFEAENLNIKISVFCTLGKLVSGLTS
jgi:hypothetical protein